MTAVEPERLTVSVPEPERLSLELRPGDLAALTPAALADAAQWTALAALARADRGQQEQTPGAEALQQLARHGNTPTAFAWLWALLADAPSNTTWTVLQQLPTALVLPEALVGKVTAEMTGDPAHPHRRAGRLALLHVLEPSDPGTVQAARAVLAARDQCPADLVDQAARLLGASGDASARADLLAAALQAARAEHPDPLRAARYVAALAAPFSPAEAAATGDAAHRLVEDYLLTHRWGPADVPQLWPALRTLLLHLPADALVELCSEQWTTQPGVAWELFASGFLERLGPSRARVLVEASPSLTAPLVQALLEHVHELPDPAPLDLLELAHQLLPVGDLSHARLHLVREAEVGLQIGGFEGMRQRERALLSLQRCALTAPRTHRVPLAELADDASVDAWVSQLRFSEVQQVSPSAMASEQRQRFGAALGALLLRAERGSASAGGYRPSEVSDDTSAVLLDLDDAHVADILTGIVAVAPALLTDVVLQVALTCGSLSTAVVARAASSSTAAVLMRQERPWPAERVVDVLAAVDPGADTVATVQELVDGLDWPALEGGGDLQRAAAALADHPALLQRALAAAISTVNAGRRQRATTARVSALVRALLQTPAASRHLGDPTTLISELVNARPSELHDLAAEWLSCAPRIQPVVDLAVQADRASNEQPSCYAPARRMLAADLCVQALDEDVPHEQRLQALNLAATAEANVAHTAALTILGQPTAATPLRRAAATTLAATPPGAADSSAIEHLLNSGENDAEVVRALTNARRRLTSTTLDEALTNALNLVGAQGSFGPLDLNVCLPDQRCHERFQHRVDQACRAGLDTSESRINALVLLADQVADQAIAAHWASGTPKQQDRAEAILDNAHTRLSSGTLANNDQQLRTELDWIKFWAALREMRTGHPAPLGSTTPRPVDEADADAALPLARRVLEGWVQTMYAAADQVPPPADS